MNSTKKIYLETIIHRLAKLESDSQRIAKLESDTQRIAKLESDSLRLDKLESFFTKVVVGKESNQKSLNSEVKEWVSNFSGHGFSSLVSAKNIIFKLIWCLAILCSTICCFYFIVSSVQQFLEFNVVTITKVKKVDELALPALTLCGITENITVDNIIGVKSLSLDDLKVIEVFAYSTYLTCVAINLKKLDSNETLLKSKNGISFYDGLSLEINVPAYFVLSDNSFLPTYQEFINTIDKSMRITIDKTIVKTLGRPYNQCVKSGEPFDSDLYRETVNLGYTYRQNNCFDLCYQKQLQNNCTDPSKCFINFNYQKCTDFCPTECDSVSFTLNVKETPSEPNEISLYINYNKHEYMEIDQIPKMTVTDLVSNIGGTLGFFLGLSFLSFIEIFDLVVKLWFNKIVLCK